MGMGQVPSYLYSQTIQNNLMIIIEAPNLKLGAFFIGRYERSIDVCIQLSMVLNA